MSLIIFLFAACILRVMICTIVNWHGMGYPKVPAFFTLSNCAVFYGLLACTLLVPLVHRDNLLPSYNMAPMRGVTAQLVHSVIASDANTLNSAHHDTSNVPARDPYHGSIIFLHEAPRFCSLRNNLCCALPLLLSDLRFIGLPVAESLLGFAASICVALVRILLCLIRHSQCFFSRTFRFPIDCPSQFVVWLFPLQLAFCFVLAVTA